MGPSFKQGTQAPISLLPGTPIVFSIRCASSSRGATSAVQHHAERQGTALQPVAGALWPSQATPYASAFMAPPAWPVYSYMPRPPAQQALMQAEI